MKSSAYITAGNTTVRVSVDSADAEDIERLGSVYAMMLLEDNARVEELHNQTHTDRQLLEVIRWELAAKPITTETK